MGIYISFKSDIAEKTPADVFAQLADYAREHGLFVSSPSESSASVKLCHMGDVLFNVKDGALIGESQTNVVGPGFHVAALEFIEGFFSFAKLKAELDDEGGYATHRDFDALRGNFNGWLKGLIEVMTEKQQSGEFTNLLLCWNTNQYTPKSVDGSIAAPIGRFNVEKLFARVERDGIDEFAREFFIWNEIEKDARFFRNSALALMWEHCYFEPSARSNTDKDINDRVIGLLERTVSLDSALPFPVKDYLRLCELGDKQPIDVSALTEYEPDYEIGFRKDTVSYRLGNLSIPAPGNCLYENQDGRDVLYDAHSENWHRIAFYGLATGNKQESFKDEFFEGCDEVRDFELKNAAMRVGLTRRIHDPDGGYDFSRLQAIVLSAGQVSFIYYSFDRLDEMDWALDLAAGITAQPPQTPPQTH